MTCNEKILCLLDGLNERDQKRAYEFIQSLARSNEKKAEQKEVIDLFGRNYFIVPD